MLFLLSAPEKSNLFSGATSAGALYETFIILVSVSPPSPESQTYFPLLCTSQAAVLSIIIRDIKKMDDTTRLIPLYKKRGQNIHNTTMDLCLHHLEPLSEYQELVQYMFPSMSVLV